MKFTPLPLAGSYLIDLERKGDSRGFFARAFCQREFGKEGLDCDIAQINCSFSARHGTLRGMHYQLAPHAETKIVRCIRGRLWDVMLDLREGSPTFGKWYGHELTDENRSMLYIPKGFAHGFMTLEDDTEILYLVTEYYSPAHERTVRWNDPTFAIKWPAVPTEVSEKDRNARDFDRRYHLAS